MNVSECLYFEYKSEKILEELFSRRKDLFMVIREIVFIVLFVIFLKDCLFER